MKPTIAQIGELIPDAVLQLGIAGVVLWWFMWKSEPRLRAIEQAIDNMARSILIMVTQLPTATEAAKDQANVLITQLDKKDAKRVEEAK